MKQSLFCLLALFNIIKVQGVHVDQAPAHSGMIEIDLDKTEYTNERVQAQQNLASIQQLAQGKNVLGTKATEGLVKKMLEKEGKDISDIDMINMKNMAYEGKFWFGKPSQEMQVIFDTGSAWAWLFSETCKEGNCPKNAKYIQSKSPGFKVNDKAAQVLQYGKGTILGHPSEDRACFSEGENHCIEHMNFLSVVKAKDVGSLRGSGLIGLAPTPAHGKEVEDPMHNGIPGFIQQMKNSDSFSKQFESQFSIYLSNKEKDKAKMTFGGYNLSKYAKAGSTESSVMWSDIASNENYWALNSTGVKFGQMSELSKKDQVVVLDNGMSFAMAPTSSFNQMLENFKSVGMECEQAVPLYGCSCTQAQYDKIPDMHFNILKNQKGEQGNFTMPKSSFLYKLKQAEVCFIMITPWEYMGIGGNKNDEYWVLGDQFLQNYYSIYDFKEKKIGLVESVTSKIKQ